MTILLCDLVKDMYVCVNALVGAYDCIRSRTGASVRVCEVLDGVCA